MKVKIALNGKLIQSDVQFANNFWTRLSGYMFRKKPHVPGILFQPANAMQTTFMFFNLDIIFISKNNEVIKVLKGVKPWRHTWFYSKTKKVLEIPAGTLQQEIKEGDELEITVL